MNRIEKLREYIDELLLNKQDKYDRRCAYIHLYGVSLACALLAKKRNVNEELAVMAGMLHDLYTYKAKEDANNDEDKVKDIIINHARDGAVYVRKLLDDLKLTTPDETDAICTAIHNHSSKEGKFNALDEVLIDADVLQHCLYNPLFSISKHELERYNSLMTELGIYL